MTVDPILREECDRFCRRMARRPAPDDLCVDYARAHTRMPGMRTPPDAVDRVLLWFGRRGGWGLALADGYARLGRPHALLRQKLTLTIALLETHPSTHAAMDAGVTGRPRAVVTAGAAAFTAGLWMGVGLLLLGPVHLILRLGGGSHRG